MCVCVSGLPLFWNFWKPGMSGNSAVLKKSGERYRVVERSENLCGQGYLNWHNACDVHGHVLRTSYNLPVL